MTPPSIVTNTTGNTPFADGVHYEKETLAQCKHTPFPKPTASTAQHTTGTLALPITVTNLALGGSLRPWATGRHHIHWHRHLGLHPLATSTAATSPGTA